MTISKQQIVTPFLVINWKKRCVLWIKLWVYVNKCFNNSKTFNTHLIVGISSSGERSASELAAVCILGMFEFLLNKGLSSDTSMLPKVAARVLQVSSFEELLFMLSSSSKQ